MTVKRTRAPPSSNVLPFAKVRKPRNFASPPVLLDQFLRGESRPKFHLRKSFNATIEIPCSRAPEKSIGRMVITIDKPITGLNLARTTIVQFVSRSTAFNGGVLTIKGEILADTEIPELIAIRVVRESVESWLKEQTASQ